MTCRRVFAPRRQTRHRCLRLKRALCYATGRLSFEDANDIMRDCERSALSYPLMVLTPQSVLDMAIERYGEQAAALEPYLADACAYVAQRWDPPAEEYWHPRDWALSTAIDHAAKDGITLADAEEETEHDANPVSKGEVRNA